MRNCTRADVLTCSVQVPGGFILLGQDGRYEEFQLNMASIVPDWGEDVSSHNESDSAQAHPKKQREKRLFGAFDQCIDEFFSLAESHRAER